MTSKTGLSYNDMIDMAVCYSINKSWMLSTCKECPGMIPLNDFLSENIQVENIIFKQWETSDRASLITQIRLNDEFMEKIVK